MKDNRRRALVVLMLSFLIAGFQGAAAQVIISEVDPATGTIELHNTGGSAVDVSSFQLCNRPSYAPISNLAVVSGSTIIPADGLLVVVWDGVAAPDAELGLYLDNQFGNSNSMLAYVSWGSAGHGRESVAVEAGLWTSGGFITAPGAGETIAATGGGADPVAAWSAGAPTFGNTNIAVSAPDAQGDVIAALSGSQVVPPVNTPASGQVTATLDGNVLSVNGSYQNLTSAINVDVAGGAHVHRGAPGDNGPIAFSLQNSGGTQGRVSGVFNLEPDQVQAFQSGQYYVQLHTIDNPPGELRAQLIASAASSIPVSALFGVWQVTSSHVVEFRPDGKYRVANEITGLQGGPGFSEGTYELSGSRLEVRDAEALQCSVADLGLYEVQVESDQLRVVLVEDRCLERAALWPAGLWQRLR